jgi:Flp pilus assembly pilin Flp
VLNIARFSSYSRLGRSERGAVAIEYAVLGGIVALGILSALVMTKSSLNGTLTRVATYTGAANLAAPQCAVSSTCFALGTTFPFGSSLNPASGKVLTSGFSTPEPGHVWSVGKTSTMTIDLGNLANSGQATGTLSLATNNVVSSNYAGSASTEVLINGVSIGTMNYANGSSTLNSDLTINAAAMQAIRDAGGVATITYQTDKTIADLPGGAKNGDVRDLAMVVYSLSVR